MLHKVKGLVLNYIKFKESSVIAKIFTDRFGLQTYIINSVRSSKSKNKIALLQQLSLLDMVVYKNDSKDIQRISEFKSLSPYQDIPFDHHKSAVAMFLAEILAKSLSTEEDQNELFQFLHESLIHYDTDKSKNRNCFHLLFINQLIEHFGISANAKEIMNQIETWLPFSTSERTICIEALAKIQDAKYDSAITLNLEERQLVLQAQVLFLQHNIPSLQYIKSIEVLKAIYS
jgi:DNA repair protein RecO (recombination protein O)